MTYTRRGFARHVMSAIAVAAAAGCGSRGQGAATAAAARQDQSLTPTPAPTPTTAPRATSTTTPTLEATAEPSQEPPAPLPAQTFPTGIEPARIEIPAIGVDASVIDLDLRGAEPEVPVDFAEVGWYTQTRLPGEIGPAVVAGHIDSRTGPAVFYRLDQLVVGDTITVSDDAGETRSFAVVTAGQYTKEALPPEVFGLKGSNPDLRLITCGGTFDAEAGHYRDNFVVYATAS